MRVPWDTKAAENGADAAAAFFHGLITRKSSGKNLS